ncbi:MAG: hypothetical protein AAGJ35_04085 [Myxococcota bacterium]
MIKPTLFSSLLCYFCVLSSNFLSAAPSICGVQIKRNRKCYKELRKLRQRCAQTPAICGKLYEVGPEPKLDIAIRRCKSLYRSARKQWVNGLCGSLLYSAPHTFCGRKGIEVAVACIQQARTHSNTSTEPIPLRIQPQSPKPSTKPPKTNPPSSTLNTPPPVLSPTQQNQPEPLRDSADRVSPGSENRIGALGSTDRPITAQVQADSTAPYGGTSTSWLHTLFLLAIFGLLLAQWFWPQNQAPRAHTLHGDSLTDPAPIESLNEVPSLYSTQDQHHQLLFALKHIHETTENMYQLIHSPTQQKAEELTHYYSGLASAFLQKQQPPHATLYQNRILHAKEQLYSLFKRYSDTDEHVFSLQKQCSQKIGQILHQMGFLDVPQKVEQTLKQGFFTFEEYLQRIEQDQAEEMRQGKSPLPYKKICEHFLVRLEAVYQTNMRTLQQDTIMPTSPSLEVQEHLYQDVFVRQLLANALPQMMLEWLQTHPPIAFQECCDLILKWIESQIHLAGFQLPSTQQPPAHAPITTRIQHFLHIELHAPEVTNAFVIHTPSGAFDELTLPPYESHDGLHTLEHAPTPPEEQQRRPKTDQYSAAPPQNIEKETALSNEKATT